MLRLVETLKMLSASQPAVEQSRVSPRRGNVPETTARAILPYVIAVASVALAFGVRDLADPVLGGGQPFVMFYLAVTVAAWFGGFWPGLLAGVGGYFLADWFFISPRHALSRPDTGHLLGSALYLLVACVISGLSELMHRTERKLARSEARLKGLIGSATDAIIAIDAEQRIVIFNDGAQMIFGYPADEMIGRPLDVLIPERFRKVHRGHVRAFGLTGVSTRQMGGERVLVGLRRDGSEFPIEAQISQVEIEGERLYTVIVRDVTERKRIEGALRDREVELETILDRTPFMLTRCTRDLRYRLVSPAYAEMVGRRPEEVAGRPISEIMGETGFETIRPHVDCVLQGHSVEYESDVPFQRVGTRSLHVQYTPERDAQGEVTGWIASILDISARKRAETERDALLDVAERARADAERAAETLRRVQRVTETMLGDLPLDDFLHEVLLRVRETLDADLAVILVRKLEEEKEQGEQDDEKETLHLRGAVGLELTGEAPVRIRVGEYFAGRVAQERRPLVWNDPDPELVWPPLRRKGVHALAGVPLLSGGRLLGVLHVGSVKSREFTADEVDLLRLAGERMALGIESAARRDAERQSRETAEASNRVKDEFLAMLAHELRNPLSAVRNAITTASLDESRRPRALEIARRQTDQLTRLVDDLLDVARITQGRITLRKQRVALAEIIERAVDSTRSFIEGRGLQVNVVLAPDPIRVEADPARLEQVFVNLLSNAGKYTDAGGRIDLTTERHQDHVSVCVRDTGIGIAPEMLPHLWDLFAQADRSLHRAQGGLGIGLTVARRLVELHGGRIEARSGGLGRGAEFIVTLGALPVVTEEPYAGASPPAPQRAARVLLVEDNPDTAESLTMLLELLGHRVRSVFDGVAALDAARANVPDVMLVDIGLPGIDGYEVARRVRRDPDLKHVALVALTGYGREEDKQKAIAAGFDYHLVKPIDPDALHGLVARLGRHDSEEPNLH